MAYVNPSGTIELMRGVNLDNRYMHTLYFASKADRDEYFTPLVTNVFTNQMYTRVTNGVIRIRAFCEDINDITYMRFKNRINGRYYYAFVNSCEYVNENVTAISFEIDVIQTWFIGANALPSKVYIKRQHVNVSDDTIFKQLEPEPFGSEIYDFDSIRDCAQSGATIDPSNAERDFNGYSLVMNTSAQPDATKIVQDGIVNGTKFLVFDPSESAVNIINQMEAQLGSWDKNEQSAEIVDLYMFPKYFAGAMDNDGNYYPDTPSHNESTYWIKHPQRYDILEPQNKKLYAYPYSFLYATTRDGDSGEYRWEYFSHDVTLPNALPVEFKVNANVTGGGSIEMHPMNYNGMAENFDAKLSMNNFPKCAWAYDAYQAFVASGGTSKLYYNSDMVEKKGMNAQRQNFISNAPKAIVEGGAAVGAGILATGASATAGPVGLSAVGGAVLAGGGMASIGHTTTMGLKDQAIEYEMDEAQHKIAFAFQDASYMPNMVVGKATPNIAVGKNYLGYRFFHCHVRESEMIKIDNMLSIFGYNVNNVDTPHLHNRPYWNFIQTDGVVIKGDMPSSTKSAIAKIFDGGIFFWNSQNVSNANIGNFGMSVNNQGQILNR